MTNPPKDYTLSMYSNLNIKYQSNFNFFFSKAVNEIVFNQTTAINTILFKDAAIQAESTQYLKRHYYLVNALGNDQIFDRIGMLSEFYTGAIILRYEYPLMILTKTKEIFLKRLKRYKHMLNEQGSSDESKSNQISRSIQLHVNTFLDSVDSSQLSKKTAQLNNQQFLLQSPSQKKQNSFQLQIHHVYNPQEHQQPENSLSFQRKQEQQQSFAQKMLKLSKNISLIQMIAQQTIQLNLAVHNFTELSHLVCDFDQIDVQDALKKYQKVPQKYKKKERSSKNILYQNFNFQRPQRNNKNDKNFIYPLDQNRDQIRPFQFQVPKIYKTKSKQMQRSVMSPSDNYQPEWKKRSQFHQTKRSSMLEQQFNQNSNQLFYKKQHQNSKSNERQRQRYSPRYIANNNYQSSTNPNNFTKKQPIHQNNYNFMATNNTKSKFISTNIDSKNNSKYHAPNNYNFHLAPKQKYQHKQKSQERFFIERDRKYDNNRDGPAINTKSNNNSSHYPHNSNVNSKERLEKYSNKIFHIQNQNIQNSPQIQMKHFEISKSYHNNFQYQQSHRYDDVSPQSSVFSTQIPVTQFRSSQQRKVCYSPKFKDMKEYERQRIQSNTKGKKAQIVIGEKQDAKHKINSYQRQTYGQIQQVQLQKLQKKRKIRQKAAQLLNRVKSQQYLINRGNLVQSNYKNY